MTLTPGALSKASVDLGCQDTRAATGPINFLLIDVRSDGRIAASRFDNATATQQPTPFFDVGFTNQNRFDPALKHGHPGADGRRRRVRPLPLDVYLGVSRRRRTSYRQRCDHQGVATLAAYRSGRKVLATRRVRPASPSSGGRRRLGNGGWRACRRGPGRVRWRGRTWRPRARPWSNS